MPPANRASCPRNRGGPLRPRKGGWSKGRRGGHFRNEWLSRESQRLWETGRWQRIYENWFGEKAKYRTDVPFVIVPFPR